MARFPDWRKDDIQSFWTICRELFVDKKSSYNSDRMGLPFSIESKVVELTHKGYYEISKFKVEVVKI